jgi:hypothetical protein
MAQCTKCESAMIAPSKSGMCRTCFTDHTIKCKECLVDFKTTFRNKIGLCSTCLRVARSKFYRNKNKERVQKQANEGAKRRRKDPEVKQREREVRLRYLEKRKQKTGIDFNREYYLKNKDKYKKPEGYYKAKYHEDIEKSRKKNKERYYKNHTKTLADLKKRHKREKEKDPIGWKISHNLRERLAEAARAFKAKKKISVSKDLGCSIDDFKIYIEKLWTTDMSWENYGKVDGWVFDHTIPLSYFDLSIESNQRIACYYKNIRPLTFSDNAAKGDQIIEGAMELLEEIKRDLGLQGT